MLLWDRDGPTGDGWHDGGRRPGPGWGGGGDDLVTAGSQGLANRRTRQSVR